MLSINACDVRIEFPIFDTYTRSFKHQFGLGRLATNLNRALYRSYNVGGQIRVDNFGQSSIVALDDVTFSLREGDRVGLLGHNGSGKTTLLRAISGIYEPVAGKIDIAGRVTPLFDLQLGMDADSTGIENIWLRGRMLDLSDARITEIMDDVAQFTELGDYLHMPIRTYSTGMMVRLAFGVSTAIAPEILVLDEMIGAGDRAFFERARIRLEQFIERTGILVVASHNLGVVRQWCTKAMLLEQGKIIAFGPIDEVIARYQSSETA